MFSAMELRARIQAPHGEDVMKIREMLHYANQLLQPAPATPVGRSEERAPYLTLLEDRILYSAAPLAPELPGGEATVAEGGEDLTALLETGGDPFLAVVPEEEPQSHATAQAMWEDNAATAASLSDSTPDAGEAATESVEPSSSSPEEAIELDAWLNQQLHTTEPANQPPELIENVDSEMGDDLEPISPSADLHEPLEADVTSAPPARRELVVIDRAVENYQQLVDGLADGEGDRQFDLLFLDANGDGVQAITEALSGETQYDGVHIVSHGKAGAVKLGNVWLRTGNLAGYAGDLALWERGLTSEADLLFYGCNLAGHAEGQALVDAVSELTGADAAASDDDTGHASRGGDWALEYAKGDIETPLAFSLAAQETWNGELAASSRGTLIWRSSGDDTPNVREWDGVALGPAGDTANVGSWRIIDGAEATTRDEILVVGVDEGNVISGQMWNGSSWSILPFGDLATVGSSTSQSFSVIYESRSGDALLVWHNGTSGTEPLSYRVWDGSAWSAEQTITAPIAGDVQEVRLAANPLSDEIILVVSQNNVRDYALVWDGSGWGNAVTLNNAAASNRAEIAVAYEAQSGHAVVIYDGLFGSSGLNYRTWNGAAWSAELTVAAPAGANAANDPRFSVLASDPTSDRIVLGVVAGGVSNETWFAIWDGGAWGSHLLATSSGASSTTMNAAAGFESQSGTLFVVYGEASNTFRYQIWTGGTGWSGPWFGPNLGAMPNSMAIYSDPHNDHLALVLQDDARDLHFTEYFSSQEFETNSGETGHRPFLFLFDRNAAPTIALPGGAVNYVENAAAAPIDPAATVSDPDSDNFDGGVLTVELSAGGTADDRLEIRNQGPGAGNISLSGANVRYDFGAGAVTIGTFAGGSNTPLVISFNGSATPAAVQAVMRNITFRNISDDPSTTDRTVRFVLTDGDGGVSNAVTETIHVSRQNDAPVLTPAAPTFAAISEDQTNTAGELVSALLGGSVADADSGALTGIAVTGLSSGRGTWQYSVNGGATWLDVGAVSNNSALLLRSTDRLRFVPDALNADAASVTFRAWDQTSGSAGDKVNASVNGGTTAFSTTSNTATITVTAVNDAPAASTPGLQLTDLNTPLVFSAATGNALSVSDVDAGVVQVTVAVSQGVFTLNGAAGLTFATGDGIADGSMTFSGTLASINAALEGASFTPTADYRGAAVLQLAVNDLGNTGVGGALSDADIVNIQIGATSFRQGVASYAGNEDTELQSGLPDDADGAAASITLSGAASQGLIRFDDIFGDGPNQIPFGSTIHSASLTVYVFDGSSGAATISLHRMLADWSEASSWNSMGNGLQRDGVEAAAVADSSANGGSTGPVTFDGLADTIQAWSDGGANRGWAIFNDQVNSWGFRSSEYGVIGERPFLTIDFTPPQPPSLDLDVDNSSGQVGAGHAVTFTENGGPVLVADSDAHITDSDSPNLVGMTIAITNLLDGPAESLAAATAGTNITAAYDSAMGVLTLSGTDTVAHYQQVLRTVTYNNVSEGPNAADRSISVVAHDAYADSNVATTIVSIAPVNDAPVLTPTAPTLTTITENDTSHAGELVSSIVGASISDVDPGAEEGVAVIGLVSGNGTWQFSIDGGMSWVDVGAVSNNSALLLRATDRVRFVPSGEGADAASLTYRAWDQTSGSAGAKVNASVNGGATAFSAATDVASISVMAVNNAPSLAANSLTIAEGQSVTLTSANFATTDADNAPGELTYIVSGVSGGHFELTAAPGLAITSFTQQQIDNHQVRFVHDGGEAAPAYQVAVSDGELTDGPQAATIHFTPENDAPSLVANSLTISEAESVVITSANLAAADPDHTPAELTYTVSNVAGGRFELASAPGASVTSFTQQQINNGQVVFVHDGGEAAPRYDVEISDGALSAGPQAATIVFAPVNDAPVLAANSLSITEGQTVALTAVNLASTDPDNGPAQLTYTVSGVTGGRFELTSAPGIAVTSFTPQQIHDGQVVFVHDGGEAAPAYFVSVDDGALGSAPEAAAITFFPVNDAPTLATHGLTIGEGQTVILTAADLNALDPDTTPAQLTYTVSQVTNGQFELIAAPGVAVTSFTQQQVNDGQVAFVHNGGETAPAFEVMVSDGSLSTGSQAATIVFTHANDAPSLVANNLTIAEGQSIVLTAANVNSTDPDHEASHLTYTVSNVAGGHFAMTAAPGAAVTSFTQQQVNAGEVIFVHDGGEAAPAYDITVSDGEQSDGPQPSAITFTGVNDAPVLVARDLTISEGQTVTLTSANLLAADPDTAPAQLTYTITNVSGGRFELNSAPGIAVVSFTQQQVNNGEIAFVHDGNEAAPFFEVLLSDGVANDRPHFATVAFTNVNDAPAMTANSLTIGEGATITLSSENFSVADPDNTPAELTYTVSNVAGGRFELVSAPGAIVTSFTQEQINHGQVLFVHDGGEAAPAFDVSVSDGTLSDGPRAAAISFTNTNDAPVVVVNQLTLHEGETVTVTGANLSAIDPDHGPAELVFTIGNVSGGRFAFSSDPGTAITAFTQAQVESGEVIFIHDGGETAPGYDVTVGDGSLSSGRLAAAIAFTPVNDPPAAVDDQYTVAEDAVLFVAADTGLLANDSDIDSPNLTAVLADSPEHGVLVLNVDGSFTYTPHANYFGTDSFTYRVHDGGLTSNEATVTITVVPVNDAPTIDLDADDSSGAGAGFTATFVEDGPPVNIADSDAILDDMDSATFTSLQAVLVNPWDGAAERLSANTAGTGITASWSSGVLTLSGTDTVANYQQVLRTLVYENASQAPTEGERQIEIIVNDGQDAGVSATARIHVAAVNDAPLGEGDSYSVGNNGVLLISTPGLLNNDADPDGDPLTVRLIEGPAIGSLTLHPDGSFEYRPDLNHSGMITFTYEAFDGSAASQTITVEILITATAAAAPPSNDGNAPPPSESDSEVEDSTLIPMLEAQHDDQEDSLGAPAASSNSRSSRQESPAGARVQAGSEEAELLVAVASGETTFVSWIPGDGVSGERNASANKSSGNSEASAEFAGETMSSADFEMLWRRLDTANHEVQTDIQTQTIVAGAAMALTSSAAAGYVLWTLRAGSLVAGFLTSLPAWATLDVLAVADPGAAALAPRNEQRETLLDLVTREASSAPPKQGNAP